MPIVQSLMDNNSNADEGTNRTVMELCSRAETLESNAVDSFTALDLNGSVQHEHLLLALQGLVALKLVKALPLAAIVTPGAEAVKRL